MVTISCKCRGREGKICICFLPSINKDFHELCVTHRGQNHSVDLRNPCASWYANKWPRAGLHGWIAKTVHPREEELSHKPAQLSKPGASNWLVPSPQVFNSICREYGYFLISLFATRAILKLPLYVSTFPDPVTLREDASQHSWNNLSIYAFPPFALLKRILLRVMISKTYMILIIPLWPLKEWFADLLSLLMDIPLEISASGSLLVQPYAWEFHRVLELLRLHASKLSSDSSERKAFLSRLQMWPHRTLEDPRHASTRENGPAFFIGIMEGILL